MGKTRDLCKKIRYQRNISCKDGHNEDRNSMDLTEAEDIKKRWQEYWDGWSFSSSGDLPNPGIETGSPGLQEIFLPSEPPGKL